MVKSITNRLRAPTSSQDKLYTRARNAWRLSVAAELAFSVHGVSCTVSDILRLATMGRRSYYELFNCAEELLVRMNLAREVNSLSPCAQLVVFGLPFKIASELSVGVNLKEALKHRAAVVAGEVERTLPPREDLLVWFAHFSVDLDANIVRWLEEQVRSSFLPCSVS